MDIYKAEIEKIEPEKTIERLNVTFKADIKSVEKLISFIFSKKNTTLREHRYLSDTFSEMEYPVYMRKGKGGVEVRIVFREEGGETVADIRLEGIYRRCIEIAKMTIGKKARRCNKRNGKGCFGF